MGVFTNKGDEEGNLKLNLADIDAVKNTVKHGVSEGEIEFGDDGVFLFDEFWVECTIHAGGGVVISEIIGPSGESARKGSCDGTKLR